MEDFPIVVEAHRIDGLDPKGEYIRGGAVTIGGRPYIPFLDTESNKIFLVYEVDGKAVTSFVSLGQLIRHWALEIHKNRKVGE